MQYQVRPSNDGDRRFIIETTARVRQPRCMSWSEWEPYGLLWARTALSYDDSTFVVASDDVILGFILIDSNPNGVEMLYVKEKFRGLGLGLVLLDAANIDRGGKIPCRAPTESWRQWCWARGLRYEVVT